MVSGQPTSIEGRASIRILMRSRPGATMYVLGNGPSLDVAWMKGLCPSECIGTNRIFLHSYMPRYMLFVDREVWKDQGWAVKKCGVVLLLGVDLWDQIDDVPVDRAICFEYPEDVEVPNLSEPALFKGWLTGYYAAAIAARMVSPGGRVVLAGMDLEYPDEGPDHSFGDGTRFGCHDKRFPEAVLAFEALRAASEGVVEFQVKGHSKLLSRGFSPFSG